MLKPFVSKPFTILAHLTQHRAVFGGEFALAFLLKDTRFLPNHLDVYSADFQFDSLCSAILADPTISKAIQHHEYTDTGMYDGMRTLISRILVISTTLGTTIQIHKSHTSSATAPLAHAPCSALSNFITEYGFGCSHPILTFNKRALIADQEMHFQSDAYKEILDWLMDRGFSLAYSPTTWPEFRRGRTGVVSGPATTRTTCTTEDEECLDLCLRVDARFIQEILDAGVATRDTNVQTSFSTENCPEMADRHESSLTSSGVIGGTGDARDTIPDRPSDSDAEQTISHKPLPALVAPCSEHPGGSSSTPTSPCLDTYCPDARDSPIHAGALAPIASNHDAGGIHEALISPPTDSAKSGNIAQPVCTPSGGFDAYSTSDDDRDVDLDVVITPIVTGIDSRECVAVSSNDDVGTCICRIRIRAAINTNQKHVASTNPCDAHISDGHAHNQDDDVQSESTDYADTEAADDYPPTEECWRPRYLCPSQGRFFGDRGSFVDFFDPLGGAEEHCNKNGIPPFGPMVVWRLLRTFNCEKGCDLWDDALEAGLRPRTRVMASNVPSREGIRPRLVR